MKKTMRHMATKNRTARSSAAKKEKKNAAESVAVHVRKEKKDKGPAGARIAVVGVGGAGGNALTRMYDYFPRGVEIIAINTDIQDLEYCQARKKIYIGKQVTRGLGAGMNPELGKQAAEENRDEIAAALNGVDMVFLTAGFGGGTGSGATPVIAEIAQEMGIVTVAVVTKPFSFEGGQRAHIAQEALSRIKDHVDSLITISNDRIFSVITKDTSLSKAFEAIDEVLKNAVLGVTELLIAPGIINVDFADVKSIVQNSGSSIIGVGIGTGKDRAINAANAALNSPLLETSIEGAKGILFSVSGLKDIKMHEINDVAKLISEQVDPNARIIFGTYYDRKLSKGQIKVTLVATGFGSSYGRTASLFADFSSFTASEEDVEEVASQSLFEVRTKEVYTTPPARRDGSDRLSQTVVEQELPDASDDKNDRPASAEDEWDIPAFLRKRGKKK
jgi:cell division protein FtsZ